jgi:hypothetical protein
MNVGYASVSYRRQTSRAPLEQWARFFDERGRRFAIAWMLRSLTTRTCARASYNEEAQHGENQRNRPPKQPLPFAPGGEVRDCRESQYADQDGRPPSVEGARSWRNMEPGASKNDQRGEHPDCNHECACDTEAYRKSRVSSASRCPTQRSAEHQGSLEERNRYEPRRRRDCRGRSRNEAHGWCANRTARSVKRTLHGRIDVEPARRARRTRTPSEAHRSRALG